MSAETDRIVQIELDEKTLVRRRPEVEHERRVAIFDLTDDNTFAVVGQPGPYVLHLRLEDLSRMVFDIRAEDATPLTEIPLGLKPFQRLVKDYFTVCASYYEAIKKSSPSQIEAIDMGRRGMHNEGAEMLMSRLKGKVEMDFDTARRLFTLICVLHVRA